MMRSALHVLVMLLCGLAIASLAVPQYKVITALEQEREKFDQLLATSRQVQEAQQNLALKYDGFTETDRQKLGTLLPENFNNVKLILEIQQLSERYGISMQNITVQDVITSRRSAQAANPDFANNDFETIRLEFSLLGSYGNFTRFLSHIERSLRIVDIHSVGFSASDEVDVYEYNITVDTYSLE